MSQQSPYRDPPQAEPSSKARTPPLLLRPFIDIGDSKLLLGSLAVGALFVWIIVANVRGGIEEGMGFWLLLCGVAALLCLAFAYVAFDDFVSAGFRTFSCPVCGVSTYCVFGIGGNECRHCSAYLRIEGDLVYEERLERVDDVPWFSLSQAQRQGITRFVMPDGCAMCGRPATRRHKVVDKDSVSQTTKNLNELGHVVGQAAVEAGLTSQLSLKEDFQGKLYSNLDGPSQAQKDTSDLAVLDFGLCDAHADKYIAICTMPPYLCFARYGTYREFCRLNGITGRKARTRS